MSVVLPAMETYLYLSSHAFESVVDAGALCIPKRPALMRMNPAKWHIATKHKLRLLPQQRYRTAHTQARYKSPLCCCKVDVSKVL